MKKAFSIVLAALLALTTLASCATDDAAGTTTTAPGGDKTTTTTKEPVNTPPIIIPGGPQTGDEGGDDTEEYIKDFPNATAGDIKLRALEVSGYGLYEDEVTSDTGNFMAVFTNDTMISGKLTATFTGREGDANANDNGIVFGMEDFEGAPIFWENGPAYYMLFVSDAGHLYLSKVAYQGAAWNALQITDIPIANYVHGDRVTITAEWDGAGNIKGYANGELLINYTDAAPLSGTRYGVRCEGSGVIYHSVVAEHN